MSLDRRVKRIEQVAEPRIKRVAEMRARLIELLEQEAEIKKRQAAEPDYVLTWQEKDLMNRVAGVREFIDEADRRKKEAEEDDDVFNQPHWH